MSIRKSSWHQAGLRAVRLFDLPKTWLDPKSQKLARIETWLWHFFANGGSTDRLTTLERCGMPWPEIAVLWSFAASKIGSFSEMVWWWSTFNWDLQHWCLLDNRAAECKIYEGRALSLHPLHCIPSDPLHHHHHVPPPSDPPTPPCSTSSKWCYGDNDDCVCGWRCQPDNSLATPCCPQLTSTAVFVYRWIFNILE